MVLQVHQEIDKVKEDLMLNILVETILIKDGSEGSPLHGVFRDYRPFATHGH